MENYDVIIIGGGPAGLSAAIYAIRGGCSVMLLEGGMIGGQSSLTNDLSNYPGIKRTTGAELALTMQSQAEELGLNVCYEFAEKVDLKNKEITTKNSHFKSNCIILCMGAKPRKLNVKGEDEFLNAGVHYCASCDGAFYRGKDVVVIGGANSAVEEAIYLANICNGVKLITHSDRLKCQPYFLSTVEKLQQSNKLEIMYNVDVQEILGDNVVKQIVVKRDKKLEKIATNGVFVAIGRVPDNHLINGQIELSKSGFIKTDENMKTSIDGVFAAGDIRVKEVRQVITASADGAIAGTMASQYINERR